jgi:hypothetical protein
LPDGTSAQQQKTQTELRIAGTSPTPRSYEVITSLNAAPAAVQLDGSPLPQAAWRYDPTTRQLHATFTATNFTLVLALAH